MLLDGLNPDQKKAVLHTDGAVMILAGAGSGKTRTLVARLLHLLDDHNVSPHHILAMTFSNKAAREMRERVAVGLGTESGALNITTFHSFCARLLRREGEYLGLSRNFTIYDDSESVSVMKAVLARRGISPKQLTPKTVLYYIDQLKNLGHYLGNTDPRTLEDVDQDDEFYPLFEDYEAEIQRSNATDFGGLICGALSLFRQYPEVLKRYQQRFRYVLVDEYQDTNRAQFQLLKLLCGGHGNICVVGDEDQSIYSWRGADIRNILDFENLFPDAQLIKLEQNYRSSGTIIEAASHVISKNEQRKGKSLWTDNPQGDAIDIVECSDDRQESQMVGQKIQKLIDGGVNPSDIAVFYRNNAQSRVLEDDLRKRNLPYRIVGGIKFYDRKEIKDMLAYLRPVVNPMDSLALARIINTPARGVGAKTLRKLEDFALEQGISLWEGLVSAVKNQAVKLSAKVSGQLTNFVDLVEEAARMDKAGEKASVIYEKLLHESGYLHSLQQERTYENLARIENLEELLSAIRQFEQESSTPTLSAFLETITLDTEMVEEGVIQDQVSLMTVHGSKGLEYLNVFLVGSEESVFPSYRSLEEGDTAIEEERRLFYVAMTRAMEKLTISFARGRMMWGQLQFNEASRFLDEIPSDYYQWIQFGKKQSIGSNVDYDEFDQSNPFDDDVAVYVNEQAKRFPKGQKVRHGLYGTGVILKSEGQGPSEKVTIRFRDGVQKKFIAKYAPLELLGGQT